MQESETEVASMLDVANPKHFRIMTMLNMGLFPEEIAATVKCSPDLVRRVSRDPNTPKHVETVRRLAQCMVEVHRKQFDQLQTMAIDALFGVLDSESANHDQKLRAALAVLDRHPSGEFVKTAKNINKDELEVGFSNDTIAMLKKIADKTNPKFIDILPDPTPCPAPPTGLSCQPGPDLTPPAPAFCEVVP